MCTLSCSRTATCVTRNTETDWSTFTRCLLRHAPMRPCANTRYDARQIKKLPFSAEKIARSPYGPIWIVGNSHFQIVLFRSFVRFIVLKWHGVRIPIQFYPKLCRNAALLNILFLRSTLPHINFERVIVLVHLQDSRYRSLRVLLYQQNWLRLPLYKNIYIYIFTTNY